MTRDTARIASIAALVLIAAVLLISYLAGKYPNWKGRTQEGGPFRTSKGVLTNDWSEPERIPPGTSYVVKPSDEVLLELMANSDGSLAVVIDSRGFKCRGGQEVQSLGIVEEFSVRAFRPVDVGKEYVVEFYPYSEPSSRQESANPRPCPFQMSRPDR
jgi:hypothetical protein